MIDRDNVMPLILGAAAGIINGIIFSVRRGAVEGFCFGVLAAIIVGGVIFKLTRVMAENGEGSFKRTLLFHLSRDEVFDLCEKALTVVRNHKVRLRDRAQSRLIVKLGMTWVTPSEVITFQLESGGAGITQLEITSTPTPPARPQLCDYEKTNKIVNYLRQFSITEKVNSQVF